MTDTKIRTWSTTTVTHMNVGEDKPVIIYPRDRGGWLITYGDDLILDKEGHWVGGESVDFNTDAGEAMVTWYGQDTATAAILATI